MIYLVSNQTTIDGVNSSSIVDSLKYLYELDEIGLDLETTGLKFTDDKIIFLVLGDDKNQYVIDSTVNFKRYKDLIESKLVIGHNLKFDYQFLKKYGIEIKKLYDTYIAERLCVMGKLRVSANKDMQKYFESTSLDATLQRRLGVTMSKKVRKTFVGMNLLNYKYKHIEYAAKDIQYLQALKEKQLVHLTKWKELTTLKLENKVVIPLAEMEYEGMTLNTERWLEIYEENLIEQRKIENQLNDYILSNRMEEFIDRQYDMFSQDLSKTTVNWDSPTQTLKVFKYLIPDLESTDSNVLEKYKDIKLISIYLKYKEYTKLTGTYGKDFLKHIHSDGKIHSSFTQIINTSRMSSSNPNQQQIPHDNKYRNCYVANYKNWVFVSSDYSSQELALIAHDSQDPVWLDALSKNKDLHSICAELLFGDEWKNTAEDNCEYYISTQKCNCSKHKTLRTFAKNLNFGLSYGMGADKLADKLDITIPEATKLINKFFTVFPNIKRSLDKSANFGTYHNYIRTMPPFNTIRWFGDEKSSDKIQRESKNTHIQGSASNMTKLALYYIWQFISENKVPVKLVCTVHDY